MTDEWFVRWNSDSNRSRTDVRAQNIVFRVGFFSHSHRLEMHVCANI